MYTTCRLSARGSAAGFPDILVNNAGIERCAPFRSTSYEEYHQQMQVLLEAVFFLTRDVVNVWMESKTGGGRQKFFATKEATRLADGKKKSVAGRFAPVLELMLEERP